jgi:E3 ubiquitin-protein ligase BRE1
MKRALAERAKQSLPQPGSNSSSPEQAPPQKAPRLEVPTSSSAKSINNTATAARNSRIHSLTSAVAADNDNQDNNQNAFYLKHQNRALATELSSLQFTVAALEQERDYRRQQCLAATQSLQSLQATWTQLETALDSSATTTVTSTAVLLDQESPAPATTGSGTSVEWTRTLAACLAALGQSSDTTAAASSVEQLYGDLSQLSANVASRATALQQHILSTLFSRRNSNSNQHSLLPPEPPPGTQQEADQAMAVLQHQITELAAARDEIAARERKLRRNLYRLASGMLTTEQVILTLDNGGNADDDMHMQRQVKLEAAAAVAVEPAVAIKPDVTESVGNGSSATTGPAAVAVSTAELERLQALIVDLEQRLSSRDRTIQEVRATVVYIVKL